jgi:hypothetical protein
LLGQFGGSTTNLERRGADPGSLGSQERLCERKVVQGAIVPGTQHFSGFVEPGRDSAVGVAPKGYLLPLGLRPRLVRVTECVCVGVATGKLQNPGDPGGSAE